MYTDELKISSFGRTNTARGGSLSTARGLPSTRIFIRVSRRLSTLFSVLPAAPRLDTIGVTRQHRKTRRETRNAVVKFRSNDATLVPSVMLVKLSSLSFFISLFSLFLSFSSSVFYVPASFFSFLWSCFRYFAPECRESADTVAFYLLLENSSTKDVVLGGTRKVLPSLWEPAYGQRNCERCAWGS